MLSKVELYLLNRDSSDPSVSHIYLAYRAELLISALVWFPKGKLALPDGPGTASCPSFPVLFPNYELAMDLRLPHCLPSLAQSSLTSALLKGKESFPSYHLYVYGNPDLRQAFANLSFIESIRFPIF